jgi:hypothetical protein
MTKFHQLKVLIFLLCTGCGTLPAADTTFSGEYFYNFEFAYLTPDGQNVRWCIRGDMSRAELPERWGTSHVVVQGTLSPEGSYGNLGACKRILTVTKLVRIDSMRGRP